MYTHVYFVSLRTFALTFAGGIPPQKDMHGYQH